MEEIIGVEGGRLSRMKGEILEPMELYREVGEKTMVVPTWVVYLKGRQRVPSSCSFPECREQLSLGQSQDTGTQFPHG